MGGELEFDDKKYISSQELSEHTGLTQSRIVHLCRQGKIDGRKFGGNWIVNPDSFNVYQKSLVVISKEHKGAVSRQKKYLDDIPDIWDEVIFAEYIPQQNTQKESGVVTRRHGAAPAQGTLARITVFVLTVALLTSASFLIDTSHIKAGQEQLRHILQKFQKTNVYITTNADTFLTPTQDRFSSLLATSWFTPGNVEGLISAKSPPGVEDFKNAFNLMVREFSLALNRFTKNIKNKFLAFFFVEKEQRAEEDKEKVEKDLQKVALERLKGKIPEKKTLKETIDEDLLRSQIATLQRDIAQLKERPLFSVQAPLPAPVIIERTIERVISGITKDDLTIELQLLENELRKEIFKTADRGSTARASITRIVALSQNVDKLKDLTIDDATITSSSFAGTTGTFSGLLTASGGIDTNSITTAGAGTIQGVLTLLSFSATSTTATSTIAGGLTVDTDTLVVDFSSNRVGIGTTSPSATFAVQGDIVVSGNLTTGGQSSGGDFSVTGNTTLGDATSTDTLFINSLLASSLIPTVSNVIDLGSSTPLKAFRTGFFGTSIALGGVATITPTQLTVADTYLIDTQGTLSINTTNNQNIVTNGNIGIGTSSPYAPLSVIGEVVLSFLTATGTATSTFSGGLEADLLTISTTTATSTFANGISLSGGCFLLADGTCAGSGGGVSIGAVVDSGTAGSVLFIDASGNLGEDNTNFFYDDANAVG